MTYEQRLARTYLQARERVIKAIERRLSFGQAYSQQRALLQIIEAELHQLGRLAPRHERLLRADRIADPVDQLLHPGRCRKHLLLRIGLVLVGSEIDVVRREYVCHCRLAPSCKTTPGASLIRSIIGGACDVPSLMKY